MLPLQKERPYGKGLLSRPPSTGGSETVLAEREVREVSANDTETVGLDHTRNLATVEAHTGSMVAPSESSPWLGRPPRESRTLLC